MLPLNQPSVSCGARCDCDDNGDNDRVDDGFKIAIGRRPIDLGVCVCGNVFIILNTDAALFT